MQKKIIIIGIIGMFLLVNSTALSTIGFITMNKSTMDSTSFCNESPNIPTTPFGPDAGYARVEYVFSTSTTDPDGDDVKYGWDINGDLEVDWWNDFYYTSGNTAYMAISLEEVGIYDIRVKAQDEDGAMSDFSEPHTFFVDDGSTLPYVLPIQGPRSGDVGVEYEYTITGKDPNGLDIYLYVQWGDGNVEQDDWIGPFYSGQKVKLSHTWNRRGTFIMNVRPKNSDGLPGDPKTLPIDMSRNKATASPFLRFLEQYPILYQLLLRFLRL